MDISRVGITGYTLNKLGPIFDKAIVQERLELSALIGASFGAMTSGDALSSASIATSGTKDNEISNTFNNDVYKGKSYNKNWRTKLTYLRLKNAFAPDILKNILESDWKMYGGLGLVKSVSYGKGVPHGK